MEIRIDKNSDFKRKSGGAAARVEAARKAAQKFVTEGAAILFGNQEWHLGVDTRQFIEQSFQSAIDAARGAESVAARVGPVTRLSEWTTSVEGKEFRLWYDGKLIRASLEEGELLTELKDAHNASLGAAQMTAENDNE